MSKSQLSRNRNLWDHFRKLQWTCALMLAYIIWIQLIVTLTGLASFSWYITLLYLKLQQHCNNHSAELLSQTFFGLMVDRNSPCITLPCLQDNGGSFTRPRPHITPKVMEKMKKLIYTARNGCSLGQGEFCCAQLLYRNTPSPKNPAQKLYGHPV